jgi:hypothetical protein
MCYEFSLWSRKLRKDEQARKQPQESEQVTKRPTPAPQPAPVAQQTKVQKRETIPA